VHQHRRAGIAEPAQRTAGHHLQAVAQFEDGGDAQQDCAGRDHRRVGYVEPHDPLRRGGQQHPRRGHEERAQQKRSPSGDRSAVDIAASVRLSNADRGRGTDAQRHHVRRGDHVDGDAVGRERRLVEPCRHRGDHREYRAFEQDLAGGGQPELDEPADACEVGPPGDME